ncbi:MAG: glyoxylase-like metal-dependent hydrolase (beta-lactamase superfamily II) [Gammaproteobacteria bacterium]|jgi:glyoxylase-like metal-dependent hydrolase (beta-lactamase superfamily II)
MTAKVHPFFDEITCTYSYIFADSVSKTCAVIDAVKEFDYSSGRTDTSLIERIIKTIKDEGYQLDWILETHIHADHLSAAPDLKKQLGGRVGIGEKIVDVQSIFKEIFNAEDEFKPDGRQFDHLFKDGETFSVGTLNGTVLHTPGHTPACVCFYIEGRVFVGDTIFMPDVGTARADFPGGDAHALYASIRKLLSLPAETRMYICHDYPPDSRKTRYETSVKEQRESNMHVHEGITEDEFVSMRTTRDATLGMPTLMIPSVQINMRGGNLPPVEKNGVRYIKVPLNLL